MCKHYPYNPLLLGDPCGSGETDVEIWASDPGKPSSHAITIPFKAPRAYDLGWSSQRKAQDFCDNSSLLEWAGKLIASGNHYQELRGARFRMKLISQNMEKRGKEISHLHLWVTWYSLTCRNPASTHFAKNYEPKNSFGCLNIYCLSSHGVFSYV